MHLADSPSFDWSNSRVRNDLHENFKITLLNNQKTHSIHFLRPNISGIISCLYIILSFSFIENERFKKGMSWSYLQIKIWILDYHWSYNKFQSNQNMLRYIFCSNLLKVPFHFYMCWAKLNTYKNWCKWPFST